MTKSPRQRALYRQRRKFKKALAKAMSEQLASSKITLYYDGKQII